LGLRGHGLADWARYPRVVASRGGPPRLHAPGDLTDERGSEDGQIACKLLQAVPERRPGSTTNGHLAGQPTPVFRGRLRCAAVAGSLRSRRSWVRIPPGVPTPSPSSSSASAALGGGASHAPERVRSPKWETGGKSLTLQWTPHPPSVWSSRLLKKSPKGDRQIDPRVLPCSHRLLILPPARRGRTLEVPPAGPKEVCRDPSNGHAHRDPRGSCALH
jgi:hypothetical protein